MDKLIVTEPLDFSSEQINRLAKIAQNNSLQLEFNAQNPSRERWLELIKDARYVISGKQGLSARDSSGDIGSEGIYFAPRGITISHPFVNVAWVEKERLAQHNIRLLYAPGCNRDAVAEWIINAALYLSRGFSLAVNKTEALPKLVRTKSLKNKRIAILGHGAVGVRVAELAKAFKMEVGFLRRGENLAEKVVGAHFVVNCLSSGKENHGLLDANFFNRQLSPGAIFITMTNPLIYDIDGLLEALKSGKLSGAGIDVGNTFPGDVSNQNYKKFTDFITVNTELKHKILVTPQVAHFSDDSQRVSYDMAIENIESALSGNLGAIKDRIW